MLYYIITHLDAYLLVISTTPQRCPSLFPHQYAVCVRLGVDTRCVVHGGLQCVVYGLLSGTGHAAFGHNESQQFQKAILFYFIYFIFFLVFFSFSFYFVPCVRFHNKYIIYFSARRYIQNTIFWHLI